MSNQATRPLDKFETELLAELRSIVIERQPVARGSVSAQRTPRKSRRRFTLVAAAAAAFALTVGPSLNLGQTTVGGTSPAYAIDQQADGDIVIVIHRLDDADGLEQALADYGIPAEVTYSDNGEVPESSPPATSTQDELCGLDAGKNFPFVFDRDGSDYVLTIPADSVLKRLDEVLRLTTSPLFDEAAKPVGGASLAATYGPCGAAVVMVDG
jgi:hypothetical protein